MNAILLLASDAEIEAGTPNSYYYMINWAPPPLHEVVFMCGSILLALILVCLLIHAIRMRLGKVDAQLLNRTLKRVVITASILIVLVTVTAGIRVERTCYMVLESGGSPDPAHFFSELMMLGTLLIWFAVALSALLIALLLHWSWPAATLPQNPAP